ncbi:MAG: hypothetical protein ABI540_01930 [Spartobacteria bacterium]
MIVPPSALPAEKMDARAYSRAHEGKLMIIDRTDGRATATADFFHVESVGTHPTGLMVTGRFENDKNCHMMASAVREANPSEIEWLLAQKPDVS